MQNRWNEEQSATCDGFLEECVYASRLLGADTALVLHGGGNTSVKLKKPNFYGEPVDILYVKASGWDLADIEVPVMTVTAVGKELEKRNARYLSLSCRIAAELGARVVKTYWCEDFEKVISTCPAPVVIAGGPKTDDAYDVFSLVRDGIDRGAIGVNLGRNIWQHYDPVGVAKGLRALIHEGASADEANTMVAPQPGGV